MMSPLFNHFSFSRDDIPSPDQIKEEIEYFEENEGGHVSKNGTPSEGRVVFDFDTFRPEWLMNIALKTVVEFPGGFPHDYIITAALLEVGI